MHSARPSPPVPSAGFCVNCPVNRKEPLGAGTWKRLYSVHSMSPPTAIVLFAAHQVDHIGNLPFLADGKRGSVSGSTDAGVSIGRKVSHSACVRAQDDPGTMRSAGGATFPVTGTPRTMGHPN